MAEEFTPQTADKHENLDIAPVFVEDPEESKKKGI